MKYHIPVCVVVYEEIEVDDAEEIETIDAEQMPESQKHLKIPVGLSGEQWSKLFSDNIAAGTVASELLAAVYKIREKCDNGVAEITPCFGSVPFREVI